MPFFSYSAKDRFGSIAKGLIEEEDRNTVAEKLNNMGFFVISIKKENVLVEAMRESLNKYAGISQMDIVYFTRQLSIMVNAGLGLIDCLINIEKQIRNIKFKNVVHDVINRVQGGNSFSEALQEHPRVFNKMYVNMVKAAEEAGILGEVLSRLSVLYVQEADIKAKMKTAMTYPIVVIIVALTVVTFLLVSVLPRFISIFESAGVQLPVPTVILLTASHIVKSYWYAIIGAAVLLAIVFKKWVSSENGKYKFDYFLLTVPVIGPLGTKVIISRFSRLLSSLVHSGVPIIRSLEVVAETLENLVIKKIVENVKVCVAEGKRLSEPFQISGFFPPMVVQMISTGEETGKLDETLGDVSSFYETEVDYAIKNFTAMLEPIMLLAMGGMVGFVALSVLLPIFNLVKLFRKV